MGTIGITPSTLSSAPPTEAQRGYATRPFAGAPVTPAPPDSAQASFDGLVWTYCAGAENVLRAVPARAWADPAAQGWQRVKQNTRREVWRADIQGTPYYLKYHCHASSLRRLRRLFRAPPCRAEWAGGLFARRAGIAAARPLAYTLGLCRTGRRWALLVTEAIEPAQPLSEFWLQLRSDESAARLRRDTAQLCELLAALIARAHQAGFEHLDMHAGNILVQPLGPRQYRTVFVDLQSARRGVPLGHRAVVRNLAQLNQWFRKHSSVGDRLRFLRAYLRWRNEFEPVFEHARPLGLGFAELVAALDAAARRHAGRLSAQRDRRTARDGRYFCRLALAGGWRGMAVVACKHATGESRASGPVFERQWWQHQLLAPLRWFSGAATPACKDSHSALVTRALLDHGAETLPVSIKCPRARNWHRRLAQFWPPSRSSRGWRIGHALLHRDIATARPLAVLERRCGPLVLDSLLITEALPGALDLETFLRRAQAAQPPTDWVRLKRQVGGLLARHVRRLHAAGFEHRDCKAGNILVTQHPALALFWIDLDGLRFRETLTLRESLQALVRLHVSLCGVPGLTRTDRARFLKTYLARYGAAPRGWRALWPAIERDSAEKLRAQAARRQWKLAHYGRD